MKIRKFILSILLFITSTLGYSITYKLIEDIEFDLNNDRKVEFISIYTDDYYCPECKPDTVFVKVKIQNIENDSLTIIDEDLFEHISNSIIESLNIIESTFAAVLKISLDKNVFVFQGRPYASSSGKLLILGLDKTLKPIEILNTDLNVTEVKDINNDGIVEIIGIKWFKCIIDETNLVQEYQPYFVYSLNSENEIYEFNENLSIVYNDNNNDVWAGKDRNWKLVEIHKKNKKPFIMGFDEAQRKYIDKR